MDLGFDFDLAPEPTLSQESGFSQNEPEAISHNNLPGNHNDNDNNNNNHHDDNHAQQQQQQQQQQQRQQPPPLPPPPPPRAHPRQEELALVNGLGMWRSWGRNFTSPILALLDLFDNAMDATMPPEIDDPNYKPSENMMVRLQLDKETDNERDATGIMMMNNCYRRIPPLVEVLSIHKSCKGDTDQIGENGVGVKQACAALSELSFVFTKNRNELGLGILAEILQTPTEAPYLPSWNFITEQDGSVHYALTQRINDSEALEECVKAYGDGDLERGLDRLEKHFRRLNTGVWADQDYVFLMVMHKIRHTGSDAFKGPKQFLEMVHSELPRNYIHIPVEFDVQVLGKRLDFQYWQRRLIELTKFQSRLDPENSWKDAKDWDWPSKGYSVNIYLGFDPYRSNGKASLYIYSRRSGRLIKSTEDARHILGLSSGGTDYAQGLTIIMDDVHGNLPLTPTKQDLAFGHEQNGKIHELNMLAWLGAYSHYYYQYYLSMHRKKGNLRTVVMDQVKDVRKNATREIRFSLLHGNFNTFIGLQFRQNIKYDKIRSPMGKTELRPGQDTLVRLQRPAPPEPTAPKRGRASVYPPNGLAMRMESAPSQQQQPPRTNAYQQHPTAAYPQHGHYSMAHQPVQPPLTHATYPPPGAIPPQQQQQQQQHAGFYPPAQSHHSPAATSQESIPPPQQQQQLPQQPQPPVPVGSNESAFATAGTKRARYSPDNGLPQARPGSTNSESQQQQPAAATPVDSQEIAELKAQIKLWKEKYIDAEDEKLELKRRVGELNDKNESQEANIVQLEKQLQEADRKFRQARKALYQRNGGQAMV